jgi:hypothetical protein
MVTIPRWSVRDSPSRTITVSARMSSGRRFQGRASAGAFELLTRSTPASSAGPSFGAALSSAVPPSFSPRVKVRTIEQHQVCDRSCSYARTLGTSSRHKPMMRCRAKNPPHASSGFVRFLRTKSPC